MIAHRNGRAFDCVVVDLNTQRDFCGPDGARPVSNLHELIPSLRRVIAWTKRNQAPLVSSVESRRMWEVPPPGVGGPYCVDGSAGQRKLPFTVFPSRVRIEADNTLAIRTDLFHHCQQVIFRKRTCDLLANPKADRFLTSLQVGGFLVFGTGLECNVKALALGLLARNKVVEVVVDACGYWNEADADLAVRQIAAKGARLVTVEELLARKLDRKFRYPRTSVEIDPFNGTVRQDPGNGKAGGSDHSSLRTGALPPRKPTPRIRPN